VKPAVDQSFEPLNSEVIYFLISAVSLNVKSISVIRSSILTAFGLQQGEMIYSFVLLT